MSTPRPLGARELELGLEDRGAVFSSGERYRYDLWRRWGPGELLGWLMLNPSTADAELDDHTVRCCCRFARREGFAGIVVRNLFALRTSSPDVLFAHPAPVGPANNEWLQRLATGDAGRIVGAWGGDRRAWPRIEEVERLLAGWRAQLWCLGLTAEGQPRHPSRLPADAPLLPYADF